MKAIETRYAGCRFRSRLEARWAVFFDALGIEWYYEPEGFETAYGRYLPDFWLPDSKAWIEIKGGKPTKREVAKCAGVAREEWKKGHRFRIITGDIPRTLVVSPETGPLGIICLTWTALSEEDVTVPEFGSPKEFAPITPVGAEWPNQGFARAGWVPVHEDVKYLTQALTKARSARFEHGESG